MNNRPQHPVLVVGGGGDVGEGIVRAHLEAGAEVIVPSRAAWRLDQLRHNLRDIDGRLRTHTADLSNFDGARAFARYVSEKYGTVGHAVASIGGFSGGETVWQVSEETYREFFVDTITAHFATAAAVVPLLQQHGSYTIISGMTAHQPIARTSLMGMLGGAQHHLRQTLTLETGAARRINSLAFAALTTRAVDMPYGVAVSATDVGRLAVLLSRSDTSGQDFAIPTPQEFQHTLAAVEQGISASKISR